MKIIKIGAVWCPACLISKSLWKEIISEIEDLEIDEYDYDIDEDIIEKYNIGTKLPVLIKLDDMGNEVSRLIGEKNKKEIISFIKE